MENNRLIMIELAAKNNAGQLPDKLSVAETMLFWEFRSLYFLVKNKKIDIKEAKDEKQKFLKGYRNVSMWENIFKHHIEVDSEIQNLIAPLGQLDSYDRDKLLDITKRVIQLLDGRITKYDEVLK